jgi:general secretion pathway protein A
MYCKFYDLKEKPFNVTSDPAFFFFSNKHKEALSHLLYGVHERKGIIVLTGEIGTGKTTLTRFFINQLDKNVKTAFILNPYLSDSELLEAILSDFGLVPKEKTRLGFIWELNKFLLKESEAGNNVVLIIDEAQNLPTGMLEQVRLLSNLETEKSKLLQIVLVGQPELNDKLSLHELRQIRQRIMVRYHINPLDSSEIRNYIQHRLSAAGAGKEIEFCDDAIRTITEFSTGTPRLINMLCDRALLAGFVNNTKKIDEVIMKKCLEEFDYHLVGGRQ